MAKAVQVRRAKPLFVDPDNVPVRLVDQITFHGIVGNLLDITCCSVRKTPHTDGSVSAEAVVVARLRMDLGLAQAMRDRLSQQIEMAAARAQDPPSEVMN